MNFLLTAVPSDKKKTTSKIHDGGFLHGSLGVMGVKGVYMGAGGGSCIIGPGR